MNGRGEFNPDVHRRSSAPLTAASLVLVALAAPARPAAADDTHYQDFLVGEHALGIGGAFTALADDAAAAFYNPAGLALIGRSSISGSLSVYGFERREVDGAYNTPLGSDDFVHEDTPTFPISVGLVRKFGRKQDDGVRNHAFAFSTVIPYQGSTTYRGDLSDGTLFDHVRVREENRWLWVGPSYAYRIHPRLAVGLTGYLATRELSHAFDRSSAEAGEIQAGVQTLTYGQVDATEISVTDRSVLLRLGVLWQPTDRVRLGLMVGLPSIRIDSGAKVTRRQLLADFVDPDNAYGTYSDQREERDGSSPFPLHVRLGAAALLGLRSVVSADVSLYAPVSYDLLEIGQVAPDDYFVPHVERQLTFNANVGFETLLGGHVPLRAGVFTNFSSAPTPEEGAVAMNPHVDRFGASLSTGYRDDDYDIQVGIAGLTGAGTALVPSASGDPFYVRTDMRANSVYLFISGAKEAVGRVVTRWTN